MNAKPVRNLALLIVAALAQFASAEEPAELLLSIQGKGSSAAYDVGVIQKLYEQMPAMRENRVVISASSSGSILATYLATHGFSEESIREFAKVNAGIDRQAIRNNENLTNKAQKVLTKQPIEMSHDVLKETIAAVLGVKSYGKNETIEQVAKRSKAKIVLPVVICAANYEVIGVTKGSLKDYRPLDRVINYDNYSVYWTDEAYERYRKDPALFARLYPDLKLGPTKYVGKMCTYFIDETTYRQLSQIPEEERLADLRLMTEPADLALAILASASEPTYFMPAKETRPGKLMAGEKLGDLGNVKRRSYCGGFIMPVVAQDIRRVQPQLFTFNTGGGELPLPVKLFLQSGYLVDYDRIQRQNDWWVDISATVNNELFRKMAARDLTGDEEFAAGYARAAECLQVGRALPRYVVEPKYSYPLSSNESAKLATMRGLPVNIAVAR